MDRYSTVLKGIIFEVVCILILFSTISFTLYAAVEFPDTPAGKRAKEIFDMLNNLPDSRKIEAYITDSFAPPFRDAFPLERHKDFFTQIPSRYKKLNLVKIVESSSDKIKFLVKSDSQNAWLNIMIDVETEKPHRISMIGLRQATAPENVNSENTSMKKGDETGKQESRFSNPEEFHADLLKKTENNEFSGVVLVAKDGKPIFNKAYGLASKRFDVPNKLDTKFNLGSCNKLFTTLAAVQLMEQGKLSIDDPIGKYLDMFPTEISKKVTVKHLMNMRSGWGDYWNNENFLAKFTRLRKVSDYMDFIKDIPLDFEPGTNMQHSNTGFIVLGAIIEKITGIDYYQYVKKNIYEPSGMKNTDSYQKDGPVKNLAVGYTNMNQYDSEGKGYKWNNMYDLPPRGTPTGGGYSTAEDILKFYNALINHKLLNPDYTNFLFNRFRGKPGDEIQSDRIYAAAGGAPGVSTFMGTDLKSGYTIVVLSNYDFPAAMSPVNDIKNIYGIK